MCDWKGYSDALTEDDVKEILRNYGKILHQINDRCLRIKKLSQEVREKCIEVASMPGRDPDRVYAKSSNHTDLGNTYLRYLSLLEQAEQDYNAELEILIKNAELIRRVYICFEALNYDLHEIVEKLYIQGLTYKAAEFETNFNHRVFEEKRSAALKLIIKLYESDLNNADLIKLKNVKPIVKNEEKKHKKSSLDMSGQLSFDEFL